MILQRLATSIRKQDWFTVLIETLIVVFGVFIGLQVNNWNTARADRALGHALVERLYEDITASIELQETYTRQSEERFARARDLSEMLRAGALNGMDERTFRAELVRVGPWAGIGIVRTTLNELEAGRMALITDETLKRDIIRFSESVEGSETAIANLGTLQMRNIEKLSGELVYAWEGETRTIVTPLADMLADRKVAADVEKMTFVLNQVLRIHRATEAEMRTLHAAIAGHLGVDAKGARGAPPRQTGAKAHQLETAGNSVSLTGHSP